MAPCVISCADRARRPIRQKTSPDIRKASMNGSPAQSTPPMCRCSQSCSRLGATPGIHTSDPRKAHLFVVPFLGGFIERVSPQMSNVLDREQRSTGRGVVDKLIDHLPHFANSTSKRHLFLFTNSCGGCLRQPCHRCASWQNTHLNRDAGVELAATLGPSWPVEKIAPHVRPPVGRKWIKQLIIPPNVMEAELHPPLYKPLCMPGADAASAAGSPAKHRKEGATRLLSGCALFQWHSCGGPLGALSCCLWPSITSTTTRHQSC